MADTVNTKWLHPSNWDGNPPSSGGYKEVKVNFTCLSDGTGETGVKKVDISTMRLPDGSIPSRTTVKSIKGHISGLNVYLYWDRTSAVEITRLLGGAGSVNIDINENIDDVTSGGTGDIYLTTTQADVGDGYNITLELILR